MTEERSRHSGVESNDQSGGLTKLERRVNSFKRLAYSGVDVWLDDLSRSLLARTFRRRLRTYRVPRSCRQNSRTVRDPAGIKAQEVRSFYPRSKRAHLVHGRTVDDHLTRSLGTRYFV